MFHNNSRVGVAGLPAATMDKNAPSLQSLVNDLRKNQRSLLVYALISCLIITLIGWFTDIQEIAYGALITTLSIAFLPFVIVLSLVAIVVGAFVMIIAFAACALMLSAIAGEGAGLDVPLDLPLGDVGFGGIGEGFGALGEFLCRVYYPLLFRIKHPAFWGVLLGGLWGGILLIALYFLIIILPEKRTVEVMLDVRHRIETQYEKEKRYPKPNEDGTILWEDVGAQEGRGVILDGFGQPLVFQKEGAWRFAAYSLRSLGRDEMEGGGDDFLIEGATTLKWLADALDVSRADGKLGIELKFKAIDQLRVEE